MKLFYNSLTYTYTPISRPFTYPRAINWRHSIPGEVIEPPAPVVRAQTSLKPQAVNWRYQLPGME
jgi:hypothetical protein